MQAVILAAGKSTRTYPLTLTRPKPLLKVGGKTLLEYNLDNLNGIVSQAIIVVGYKKNMVKKYFGDKYKNIRIRYIEQKQQLGTAHAISVAEPYIKGRFILMMGDDIYQRRDIQECVKHAYSILVTEVENPGDFGVVKEQNGILMDIIEKPDEFISNLISTALYVLDQKIFEKIGKVGKGPRGEYEFPDALVEFTKKQKVNCVKATQYLPVAYPWDLLKADKFFRKNKNLIGKNSKITGNVENSATGNNCIIKGMVKNSIIMDNTTIEKGSVVENSIIGENVYFDGKIIAGNNVYSVVKGKKINAGKLGAIIGDDVKAENVVISPGAKIWPNKKIKGEIKNDIT